MYYVISGGLTLAVVAPLVFLQVWAIRRARAHLRLQREHRRPRPTAPAPTEPAAPDQEIPAHLRRDIDHALRLAEAEHNGRQFAILWRSYQRLANMFPDVMADILHEEKARAEERDRGTEET